MAAKGAETEEAEEVEEEAKATPWTVRYAHYGRT